MPILPVSFTDENLASLELSPSSIMIAGLVPQFVEPSLAQRRNVRRCLFPSHDDNVKDRTDRWLDEKLAEMRVETRLQSQRWGFDFEKDVPMLQGSLESADNFFWTPVPSDRIPEFYSRPPPQNRQSLLNRAVSRAGGDRTPSKRPFVSAGSASIGGGNVKRRPESAPASTLSAATIVLPLVTAPVTEFTPSKPLADLEPSSPTASSSSSTSATSSIKSPVAILGRRRTANGTGGVSCDQQTELKSYFPAWKKARWSTADDLKIDNGLKSHISISHAASSSDSSSSSGFDGRPKTLGHTASDIMSSATATTALHRPSSSTTC